MRWLNSACARAISPPPRRAAPLRRRRGRRSQHPISSSQGRSWAFLGGTGRHLSRNQGRKVRKVCWFTLPTPAADPRGAVEGRPVVSALVPNRQTHSHGCACPPRGPRRRAPRAARPRPPFGSRVAHKLSRTSSVLRRGTSVAFRPAMPNSVTAAAYAQLFPDTSGVPDDMMPICRGVSPPVGKEEVPGCPSIYLSRPVTVTVEGRGAGVRMGRPAFN